MIQLSNHLTSGTHLYASTRKQASGFGAASFQDTLKRNSDLSSKNLSQDMKKEIMHQFPGLTEERLNDLISHYDIENMTSDQLFQFADKLMKEGIIPASPQENGLNMIAVFPKSLYDAILRGEQPDYGSVTICEAPDYLYTVNQEKQELNYNYPRYGLKYVSYELHLLQKSAKMYESYYTDEERSRQLQLTHSKERFYDLVKMLTSYQEEFGTKVMA